MWVLFGGQPREMAPFAEGNLRPPTSKNVGFPVIFRGRIFISGLTSPVLAGTIGAIVVQVSVATDEKGIRLYSGTGPPLYPGTNPACSPLLPYGNGKAREEDDPEVRRPT